MLSASPALHQAHPIISVVTQINARLRLTVQHVCKSPIQLQVIISSLINL